MATTKITSNVLADGAALSNLNSGASIAFTKDLSTNGNATVTGNLTINSNTLFVDSVNNRVGIGTLSPSDTLSIVGTLSATGLGTFSGITATAGTFGTTININTATGSTVPGTGFLANSTSASSTTRQRYSPVIRWSGSAWNGSSSVSSSIDSYLIPLSASPAAGTLIFANRLIAGVADATPILALNTDGNVGIGITRPTEKLTILGNLSASGSITSASATIPTINGNTVLSNNLQVVGQLTAPNQTATDGSSVITRDLFDSRGGRYLTSVVGSDEAGTTNSTTLIDSVNCSLTLEAGTWDVECLILVSCVSLAAGSRQKLNWSGTSSSFNGGLYYVANGAVNASTWPNSRLPGVAVDALRTSTNESITTYRVGRLVATSSGVLSIQFASGVATVGVAPILNGISYLRAKKV